MSELLSSKQAAFFVGLTLKSFYQLVKKSKAGDTPLPLPPSIRSGTTVFYNKAELQTWLRERKEVHAALLPPNKRWEQPPARIHIYIPQALKNRLIQEASKQDTSMNTVINYLLEACP